jgi:hypothetical protein
VFFARVERAFLPAALDLDSDFARDFVLALDFDSVLDFVFAFGWRSGSPLR